MISNLDEDRGPILIGVTSMLLVLCFTATGARFLARRVTRTALAADDYVIIAALVRCPWSWEIGSPWGDVLTWVAFQFLFTGLATICFLCMPRSPSNESGISLVLRRMTD
jgi:hypothetical protein